MSNYRALVAIDDDGFVLHLTGPGNYDATTRARCADDTAPTARGKITQDTGTPTGSFGVTIVFDVKPPTLEGNHD